MVAILQSDYKTSGGNHSLAVKILKNKPRLKYMIERKSRFNDMAIIELAPTTTVQISSLSEKNFSA